MANEKQYAKWIDIPDGSGGYERKWVKDEEAATQEQLAAVDDKIPIPVDVSALTPISTFVKNSVIGINGVWYMAKRNTSNLPFTLVVQDGAFVVQEVGGVEIFIIADNALNGDWFPWSDASVQAHLTDLDLRMAAIETLNWEPRIASLEQNQQNIYTTLGSYGSRIAAVEARTQSVTYNGQTYTLQQIMQQMAKLMDKTVIYQTAES